MDKYNIEFIGPYAKPKTQRVGDEFLMNRLLRRFQEYFTPKEIRSINKCRIFLQVLTLADIYDRGGKNICANIRTGTRLPERTSKYKWPYQVRPLTFEWRSWRKAIDITWTNEVRLGAWFDETHQKFNFLHSSSTEHVYE